VYLHSKQQQPKSGGLGRRRNLLTKKIKWGIRKWVPRKKGMNEWWSWGQSWGVSNGTEKNPYWKAKIRKSSANKGNESIRTAPP